MSSLELPQRVSKAQPPRKSPIPAHLQCSSCSKPLFNAFQTPHGCRLCQPCVNSRLSSTEKRRCPGTTEACRDPDEDTEVSQSTCLPDMATRREVGRLQVLCPNCNAGCSVALNWNRMDEHLDSCDFQTVDCGLCSQPVMRKDSRRHAGKECLSECPERPVDCKYSHLGCRVKVRRSDIKKHYRDFAHCHVEFLDSRLVQVEALLQQLQSLQASAQVLQWRSVITSGQATQQLPSHPDAASDNSSVQPFSAPRVPQFEED